MPETAGFLGVGPADSYPRRAAAKPPDLTLPYRSKFLLRNSGGRLRRFNPSAEKDLLRRLLKKAQMQGIRNPEE